MIHITTNTVGRRLPFYLAMEEWAARCLPAAEYFFCWRVDPTIIIGRNQDMYTEVNLDYCHNHNIQIYRRRSGGGCVYADQDNVMMSYVCPSTEVTTTFAEYTRRVARMLCQLGVDARPSGRNDILIDGRKVSGNAFYHLPERSIVHGTMLVSTDMDHMLNAITPDRAKLESNSVTSVQSRITTLSEHLPHLTAEAMQLHMEQHFADSQYVLTDSDLAAICDIEQRYYDPAWLTGSTRHLSDQRVRRASERISSVGNIDVAIALDGDVISSINLSGDFFVLSDLDSMLLDNLVGHKLNHTELTEVLSSVDVSQIIAGLDNDSLVDLICKGSTITKTE